MEGGHRCSAGNHQLPLQLPSACVTQQSVACPTCRLKHQNGHATAGGQGPNPRQHLGPNPSEGGAWGSLPEVTSGGNLFCSRDSDVFSSHLTVQLCPAGAACTLLLLLLRQWRLTFMPFLSPSPGCSGDSGDKCLQRKTQISHWAPKTRGLCF